MPDLSPIPQSAVIPPDISVIIVNWRSKDFVRKCVQSIRDHAGTVRTEIIVVDGASFDGCGEMLRQEFPTVRFIQAVENRGFGYANNLGAKEASGRYLLLLNPDTEIHAGSLERMLEVCEKHPRCGMVGPRLLNTDGSLQKSCVQAFPTPLNQALGSDFMMKLLPRSRMWGSARAFASTDPTEVEAVSGACMLLSRELYRTLRGFDESYFMYAEDMDLCYRIAARGLHVVHTPLSFVTHHGGQSSGTQVSTFSTLHKRHALGQYMRKHGGLSYHAAYRLGQATSAFIRLTIIVPSLALQPQRRAIRLQAFIKWWIVLKWSCGFAAVPISPPARALQNDAPRLPSGSQLTGRT